MTSPVPSTIGGFDRRQSAWAGYDLFPHRLNSWDWCRPGVWTLLTLVHWLHNPVLHRLRRGCQQELAR